MGEEMDKAKGKVKEEVGEATGDRDLEREGKMDRKGAEVKEKVGGAVDSTKEKLSDLMDRDDR